MFEIRIVAYAILSIFFLWKFIHIPRDRWISLLISMLFFNSIMVAGSLLLGLDPTNFRNAQTPIVTILAAGAFVYWYKCIDKKRKL